MSQTNYKHLYEVTRRVLEQYYIVCQVCGFRTKKHPTRAAATRDWSGKFNK